MNLFSLYVLFLYLIFIEFVCLNLEVYLNGEMIFIFVGEKNYLFIYKYY